MNSGKEAEQNENVFIGARVLGEDGVKLVLPTYDVLISQIEQMKSVARNSEKQNRNISRIMKYNREHNNTIAIFGKRGTGKTSAVYTLMDYLLNQNDSNKKEKNIVLPIIEPDNFGDNTKIMGSIVGLIKNEVDEILTEIKSTGNKPEQYFRNCIYVENNPLKQKMDELLEHHMYSDSEYRNIITHNYTDTATHIKKSSHLLIPDINLKHKFWDVIDEIVKIYKNELNKDEDATIFIFIDDIDLKTTKCKELIEAIIQFSSHPNVITILSGDYEILEEGVMLSLIGDENLREKGLDADFILKNNEDEEKEFKIRDRKLDLAENYLKKIIPPSRRHHVVDWNIYNIPSFSFGKTKLIDKIYEFYNGDNIFGFKDNESNISSTKYPYIIFDNKPRGIINVYYNLSRIVNNDKKSFFDIKSLIDTIIDSSPELLKNKEKFYEFINWGSNFKSTQINYDKLIIKEDENSSLKESLSYFIIAEMLLYYENDISENGIYYSKNDYDLAKKDILTSLYYNASIENLCKNDTEYKIQSNLYSKNPYNMAIIFALNLEFIDSLRFLNILLESEFTDKYGYDSYVSNSEINNKKNNNFLMGVCKFIAINENQQKGILKNMKILQNVSINKTDKVVTDITDFFDFLDNIANVSKEDEIIKNKYKYIYEQSIIFDDELKVHPWETKEEIESDEDYLNNRELIDKILFNTTKKIEYDFVDSNKGINNITKKYEVKNSNLKKLKTLNQFFENQEIKYEKNKILFIMDLKEDILKEFFKLISVEDEFYLKINPKYINFEKLEYVGFLNEFLNKSLGKTINKYDECKNAIKNKNIDNKIIFNCLIEKIIYNEFKNHDLKTCNQIIAELMNSNLDKLIKKDLSVDVFLKEDGISIKKLMNSNDENYIFDTIRDELDKIKDKKTITKNALSDLYRMIEIFKKYLKEETSEKIYIIDLIKKGDLFEYIFSEIKILSDNKSIKYGQTEAKEFVKAIEENISINLNNPDIKPYIPLIYYIGRLNEVINPDLKSNEEFEEIKDQMRKILKIVSEESKLEIKAIREEIGLGEYEDEE